MVWRGFKKQTLGWTLSSLFGLMMASAGYAQAESIPEKAKEGFEELLKDHLLPLVTEPLTFDDAQTVRTQTQQDKKGQLKVQAVQPLSETDLIRDPTLPGDYFAKQKSNESIDVIESELKLTAIISYPNQRVAIINQQIVKEGDMIAGQKVTRIDSRAVTLDDSKTKRELLLLIPHIVTIVE